MDADEIVAVIAQLGLGMAGFSGIAIALAQRPGRFTPLEAYRIVLVFSLSFGAMFLALVPLVLSLLGVDDGARWRATSALIALFSAGFAAYYLGHGTRFRRETPALFPRVTFETMGGGHVLNALLQIAAAAGAFGTRSAGLAVLGLTWILFHAAFQFGRILFRPIGSTP